MKKKLIHFIRNEFDIGSDICLDCDTKLLSTGIIDSFSLVTLHAFIVKEFGKKIPPQRMTVESFDSISQMLEVIAQN